MTSTSFSSPRIRLRPSTLADLPDLVDIHFDAFGSGVTNRLMTPKGATEAVRDNFGKYLYPPPKEEGEAKHGDDDGSAAVENIIVVAELIPEEEDKDKKPEVVAFAKWGLRREALPKEKWEIPVKVMTEEDLGADRNIDFCNEFIGGLQRVNKKWAKGEPFLHLAILACSPKHQRLGAGSALLAWGLDLADKEGKVSWVESSPMGYTLYKKFGYEDVDVHEVDITERWGPVKSEDEDWGGNTAVALAGELRDGYFRIPLMKRVPKSS